MATSDIAEFFVHTGTVKTFQGESGYGVDQYSAPATKAGFLDGAQKLVRDANGEQVVASATWYTDPADIALYALDSLVSVLNLTDAHVIAVASMTSGSLDLPDHLAVSLV